jgi:outer membrane protein assembly factor BamB
MITAELSTTIAVVPIFVNAGAALVPTLVAGLTSFIAVLLKPKELLTLFRRKPWLPVSIIATLIAAGFGISHLLAAPTAARATGLPTSTGRASAPQEDWTKIALKLLEDERNANKTTGVKPLWDYAPDPTAMTLSSAAYADKSNRVFATASIQDVASFFGVLYCLDATTGREIWKTDKAGDEDLKAFFSSPALTADQKYLIVGQGLHEDRDCALLCFDTDTHALKWAVKTPLHIESSPAVRGDLAVVGAGAIEGPDHKPTSHPGYVFAVQISTGKELWRHDVNDPESSPAIADDDGTVYVGAGFNGNAVVALRSEPDDVLKSKQLPREIWRTKAPYPITAPVTLAGDLLLVGGGNSDFVNADPNPAGVVLALDRHTGAIKWQTPTDDAVLSKIVVADGKVFCPVRNGQVLALDLATGQPLWKRDAHNKSPLKAGLALSPDHSTLYAPTSDGQLTLLSATDGHPIESHPLNNPAKPGDKSLTLSTPTLAQDKLFVGSETGGLRTFQLLTPKPN